MKILKKIGIGFLALIICFCSCFKFINAEALPEPVLLETNLTYVFVIDNNELINSLILVASNQEGNEVIFNNNSLTFSYSTSASTSASVSASLTYLKTENNFTYYSFVYPIVTAEYVYEDNTLYYFEEYEETTFSIYDTIYNLIETYIFGGSIENGTHQDLTATTLSSIICILVFALPFLIIWKVLKVIMG